MSKKYWISVEDGITTVRLNEVGDKETFLEALREALEVDEIGLRLWIVTKGTNITSAELRHLANVSKSLQNKPSRSAFVAADDLTFGLARMWEAYRNDDQHDTRAFRDEAEAIKWLKGGSDT